MNSSGKEGTSTAGRCLDGAVGEKSIILAGVDDLSLGADSFPLFESSLAFICQTD